MTASMTVWVCGGTALVSLKDRFNSLLQDPCIQCAEGYKYKHIQAHTHCWWRLIYTFITKPWSQESLEETWVK